MTTERSGMSLEMVREWHRALAAENASRRALCAPNGERWELLNDEFNKHVRMADAIDAHLASLDSGEAVALSLPQSFVDRVTSDGEAEPPVMGAGVDSIKLIAEEMVHACVALRQGDAEVTHDALDDWSHRIMCFADFTHPRTTSVDARADSGEAVADICNYKDMFESAVLALADIDRLLGLPEDGCNDPQVTVSALADFIAGHNDMQKYRDEWVDAQYASHPLDLSSITALVGEMFDEASELEDDGNIGMAEELRLYANRFRVILAGADELQAAITQVGGDDARDAARWRKFLSMIDPDKVPGGFTVYYSIDHATDQLCYADGCIHEIIDAALRGDGENKP